MRHFTKQELGVLLRALEVAIGSPFGALMDDRDSRISLCVKIRCAIDDKNELYDRVNDWLAVADDPERHLRNANAEGACITLKDVEKILKGEAYDLLHKVRETYSGGPQ